MMARLAKGARRTVGLWVWPVLGLALGVATLWGVDLTTTLRALRNADPGAVALALVAVAATIAAKTVRWRLLFSSEHPAPPLLHLAAALLVGQIANTILPARIGEPLRALLAARSAGMVGTQRPAAVPSQLSSRSAGASAVPLARQGDGTGVSVAYVLGTIVVEKVVDILMASLLLALIIPSFSLPTWLLQPGIVLATFAVVLLGLNVLVAWQQEWAAGLVVRLSSRLPLLQHSRLPGQVAAGLQGLASLLRTGAGVGLWGWSLVAWVSAILTNYFTLLAVGVRLPLVASAVLLLVLQVGIAIPASLGRLGALLYLASLGLAVFGVERSLAVSFGLILFVVVYVPPVLGVPLLWVLGISPRGKIATPPVGVAERA